MSTPKQRKQQSLSWKLRMVMGARGNIGHIWPNRDHYSPELRAKLRDISAELQVVEAMIRKELANIK